MSQRGAPQPNALFRGGATQPSGAQLRHYGATTAAAPTDILQQREEFLTRMRTRAEMSSLHGTTISQMSPLVTNSQKSERKGKRSMPQRSSLDTNAAGTGTTVTGSTTTPSSSTSSSDSDDDTDERNARETRTRVHNELQAMRLRSHMLGGAGKNTVSAVSRRLPVEVVTLVPRPDCIHGTIPGAGGAGQEALYDETYSFWGIVFVVAAAVRFQRPVRRKRHLEGVVAKAMQKERTRVQLEVLRHAGLAHDTKRGARKLLRDEVAQSQADILQHQGAGLARTSATDDATNKKVSTEETLVLDSHHHSRPSRVSQPPAPSLPFEQKAAIRELRNTALRLTQGTSACGSLGKTITQRIHTAEPVHLAKYMLDRVRANDELRTDISAAVGGGSSHQSQEPAGSGGAVAHSIPPRPPAPPARVSAMPPSLSVAAIAESGATQKSSKGSQSEPAPALPHDTSLQEVALSGTVSTVGDRTPRSNRKSSSRGVRGAMATSIPSPGSAQSAAGGLWTPSAGSSPRKFVPSPRHATASSGSMRRRDDSLGAGDHQFPSETREESRDDQSAPPMPSVVKLYGEKKRRDAVAGVAEIRNTQGPITLDENDFLDIPVPSINEASAQAYPPASPRPPPPRRGRGISNVELQFLRKVDHNGFHEDVCSRLKHAEAYRIRDYHLKHAFLQHYGHGDDPGLSVHTLVRELARYVEGKRRQDARLERQKQRIEWFYRFYEAMIERCSWLELEPLFLKMESQVINEFAPLDVHNFVELLDHAATADNGDMLLLPSVQFFLCHVAVAYRVPYIEFREMLELRRTPYILRGNGEAFVVQLDMAAMFGSKEVVTSSVA